MLLRLSQQALDIVAIEQAPFPAAATVERIFHEFVEIAAHVLQRGHREVTLGPIDDSVRNSAAGDLL